MSNRRIYEIDSLRGIAALIVVFTHFQPFFWSRVVHWGFLAVDLFFILSGIVLTKTYEAQILSGSISARDFLARRFARLAPLHYLALALFLLAELWSWVTGHGHVVNWYMPLYSFFLNLVFLQNVGLTSQMTWNDVSWSISTEMVVNLLWFYVLVKLRPTAAFFISAVIVAGLFIFTTMGPNLDFTFANKFGINIGLVRCVMGFSLGVVMARTLTVHGTPSLGGNAAAIAVLALLAWVSYAYKTPGMEGADYVVVLFIYPALVFISLGRSFLSSILRTKPLVFLGDISYSVYLMHPLVARVVSRFLDLPAPYRGIVAVGAVLLVATLTYYTVEQPARRYLTWRLTSNQASRSTPDGGPGTRGSDTAGQGRTA
ncbi:acyltransferase [Cupriavidus necator]|uniref:acyltransferase family protein n=1 Tax=Cupriavidus necator TaxID=106590 RepID=UPI00149081D5|nr:acyltransferase [Cupriavidus necator]NOV25361.1 acyltransferase [Cupriavidus necator]